ncbi:2,3-bisphosphoglycerate-independent phosphoglycerate mutase [Saccharopolyspora erythraea]|uniref:2,3-bisphosphoglycerate-independent phosphoglycerate mutase n=1 Tax=Saccharopolyspora erythraea TaxID=1836 RepID=UPI001BA66B3F|nr:2,3-bisphosphoglycerate-independent phosphoglycerate mutase [Saccharopolyspora erythraea]QUH01862.1 2,3-bisphosphoglycerate-independent phosphoglycerate mutase [Saccharopolyspora erythraea]
MTRRGGVLLVLDGWGHAPPGPDNAIDAASTPFLDELLRSCPGPLLEASGPAVGLPDGVVGNSEIGHLVIGAGRPLAYDSLLVQRQAESGELRTNLMLREACAQLAGTGAALHLIGLCSDGRIHSDIEHFSELLHAASDAGLGDVWLHAITDGRDVADGTAGGHLARLMAMSDSAGVGRFATVIGRNYAMDKSGKAELTDAATRLLIDGQGETTAPDAISAAVGPGDSSLPPTVISVAGGAFTGVRDGDVILFANFRSDRTAPLVDMVAERLSTSGRAGVRLLSLAQYDTRTPVPALVPRADASGGLADALEAVGARSVRIAEREKFEHVTFFINGRDSRSRPVEEHQCVPSADGEDYVARPEMNVEGVAQHVVDAAARDDVALVIANLANIDVVGHTGDYAATVRGTEAVDLAVRRICQEARAKGRWVLLVGDHGNGEQMSQRGDDGTSRPYGGHTHNKVPCLLVPAHNGAPGLVRTGVQPRLPSVAPTVLDLLGIPQPDEMSEPSLLHVAGRSESHASPSVAITN